MDKREKVLIEEEIKRHEAKVSDLYRELREEKDTEQKEKNYQLFLNRPSDWLIGKAHAQPTMKYNDWNHPEGEELPYAVSIRGNVGYTYTATAWITSATNTYFHNVWSDKDRKLFEKKLEKLVEKEVKRIMHIPHHVLEIMGLQSDAYYLSSEDYYPKYRKESIKKDIEKEQFLVLDLFSDKELENVGDLFHGKGILKNYLQKKRPKLFKKMFPEGV